MEARNSSPALTATGPPEPGLHAWDAYLKHADPWARASGVGTEDGRKTSRETVMKTRTPCANTFAATIDSLASTTVAAPGGDPIAGGCALVAATFVDRMRVAVGASKPADAGIRRGP